MRAIASFAPVATLYDGGAGWSAVVATVLASLGLWRISRKARRTALLMLILILIFALQMVCGFATFVIDWLGGSLL